MIRAFLVWLQTSLGKGTGPDAQSWSEYLLGTLNFWSLLEGTHLLTLILFAGTILVVDLRMLGLAFRQTPISRLNRALLPLTVFAFLLLAATGSALFFAKPLFYYHKIWFRLKVVFLAFALLNILIFHWRARRHGEAWDKAPRPPVFLRVTAALSLASWLAVITMGRFIAYNWYDCGKPQSAWMNQVEECAISETGAIDLQGRPSR